MIERAFTLIPFPTSEVPSIAITGNLSFRENILTLHFALTGDLEEIALPLVSDRPARRDELWKGTCFEFFLAYKDQPGYLEFNLSPSRDWNVYWMDAYRRVGFREERGISDLTFAFERILEGYSLDVSVDLTPIIKPEHTLQMAITSVIQMTDGNETYWALAHPGSHADFHFRESFIVDLAEQIHPSPQSALDG